MQKLVIFQAGDYREAYCRLRNGGAETYRDQRASVDFVAGLAREFSVTVVACCDNEHDEVVAPNLRSIGIMGRDAWARDGVFINALFDRLAPDRVICGSPNRHALRWVARNRVPTLLSFADLFSTRGLRNLYANARLRLSMRGGRFPCLANHSLNASLSAAKALLYPKGRIISWDWSHLEVSPVVKAAPSAQRPTVFYAGMLSEEKGVGDCLDAARILSQAREEIVFQFAGPGDVDRWRARAEALGIADRIELPGQLSHGEVRERMRRADIVVVPSRHSYPEGLPNTIYEALSSRTPLVISDHPAFAGRLTDGTSCCVFRAGDAKHLAGTITRLLRDPGLYAGLSSSAAAAHDSLYVGLGWTQLVRLFLNDPADRTGWVRRNSLVALGY